MVLDNGRFQPGVKPVQVQTWRSREFNIDNGNGTTDDDVWETSGAIEIVGVKAVYTEASDSSMGEATFKVGTAVAGAQVVAATALEESKSVGTSTAGVVLVNRVPKDNILAVRHTGIATTQVGKYRVQIDWM